MAVESRGEPSIDLVRLHRGCSWLPGRLAGHRGCFPVSALIVLLVLLAEGPERVEEGHAALVEHGLFDHVVSPPQHRLGNGQSKCVGGLQIDD
jgi:hypothetical protein